jgi:hypothetical protein
MSTQRKSAAPLDFDNYYQSQSWQVKRRFLFRCLLPAVAAAATLASTNTASPYARGAWRGATGGKAVLAIVRIERISIAGNGRALSSLRVPKPECHEGEQCEAQKCNQHDLAL